LRNGANDSCDASFQADLEPETMVIVIAGCDINAVQVKEQMTGERPLLGETSPWQSKTSCIVAALAGRPAN